MQLKWAHFQYRRNPQLLTEKVTLLKYAWARSLLKQMHIEPVLRGEPPCLTPCLVVSNHTGYMEAPTLLSCMPHAAFVGKADLLNWPIFGAAMREIGCLFVNRSSKKSRHDTALAIADFIHNQKRTLVLFPEGTSSYEGLPWRHGSFAVAHEHGLKVQAVAVYYEPYDYAVCVEMSFLAHLWKLLSLNSMKSVLEFREPCLIENVEKDCLELQEWVYSRIRAQLAQAKEIPSTK